MILSKKEKEEQIIKLLHDGVKFKDIAKQLHVSLSDISKIKRKLTGDAEIQKEKSIPSQAFQLFSERKSLVEVKICLDISKDETMKIYSDFLVLHNLGRVAAILKENIKNLSVFLKWFNYIKDNNIRKNDVEKAIDKINQINVLTQQKENLEREIQIFREEREYYLSDLGYIKRKYYQ